MTDRQPKWTEIEHLPAWDEEYYDVYTAKKYGKWLMFKTLKPQYRDNPEYRAMMEREFEVRYNLSHPSIIMINDYEEVPGVGLSIITDDVYGTSLRTLIDERRVEPRHIRQLTSRLLDAIEYIQTNRLAHSPIRPETIIFTENIGNLKLINVGFDRRSHLPVADTSRDIASLGRLLAEAIDATPDPTTWEHLRHVALKCQLTPPRGYRDIASVRMAIARRSQWLPVTLVVAFIALMAALIIAGYRAVTPV